MPYYEGNVVLTNTSTIDAIIKFLQVINPKGQIYHANFFLEKMELLKKEQRKSGYAYMGKNGHRWMDKTRKKLDDAYLQALQLHNTTNPFGPLPKKIELGYYFRGNVFKYQKGNTSISLCVPVGKQYEIDVQVKSEMVYVVQSFCRNFGGEFCLHHRTETAPPLLRDIRIPLGDILNFIDRYR